MVARKKPAAAATPRANPHRGEHVLELAGKSYLLRPSYEAIATIEKDTGKALVELVRIGNGGSMPFAMAGTIAAALIRAGADDKEQLTRNVAASRIAELIFEEGIAPATARLTLCLLDAATGGRDAQGEAKAVARKKAAAIAN